MGEYHTPCTSGPSFASAEPNPGRVARVTDLRPSLELHGAGEGVMVRLRKLWEDLENFCLTGA
jgi:hypothetical protein